MEIRNYKLAKLVYFSDFGHLLTDLTDEVIEDLRGDQFCCHCAGTKDEETCECIKRKEKRDGTSEHVMSAGQLFLSDACEGVLVTANKVIEALKEKAFVCECPQEEIK